MYQSTIGERKQVKNTTSVGLLVLLLIWWVTLSINVQSVTIDSEVALKRNTSGKIGEDVQVSTHQITRSELERLKNIVGEHGEGDIYNRIFFNHGTGLSLPTKEEWGAIGETVQVIDKVTLTTMAPSSVDHTLSLWFPPIGDQDGEGSCTAWAVGYYVKTFQEAREHGWDLSSADWEGGYYGHPTLEYQDRIFSPDFIYHLINGGIDEGAWVSDAIELIAGIGICSWEKMPYDPQNSTIWPSEEAWIEAPFYRGNSSFEIMELDTDVDIANLKNWLASNHLAIITIDAEQFSNLTSLDVWTLDNYVSPMINHANTVVGYDDNLVYVEEGELTYGAFKVANSWGEGGWEGVADGCYWISYAAMKQRVGYCTIFRDMMGYKPELIATFNIDHDKRGECDITLGMGNHTAPIITKSFSTFVDGGDHPFPSNRIVFDITEFKEGVAAVYNRSYFLKVYDNTVSATVGSIAGFSVAHASSEDPPVDTVNGGYVFADLQLPDVITVPTHYLTIQKAIDSVVYALDPNPRVTIKVETGTYYEHVIIEKPLSLIGENRTGTIIDGLTNGTVVTVVSGKVSINGFTIQNSGSEFPGVLVQNVTLGHSKLHQNIITHNGLGIYLQESSNISIYDNAIEENGQTGVRLQGSSFNIICGNNISLHDFGVELSDSDLCQNNIIYHNNFIDNAEQAYDGGNETKWDNGYPSAGNYWTNYIDVDDYRGPFQNETGSDGIWDHPYPVNRTAEDNYPLTDPWSVNAPPFIIVLSPKNSTLPTNSVPLTFLLSEACSWIAYSLDTQENTTITENITLQGLSEGTHTVIVYANGTSKKIGSSDLIHFTVDFTPPTIILTSPENKTYNSYQIPLVFVLNEPASWISYTLDGQQNYTVYGNATILVEYGSHQIIVYAKDTAGNMAASATTSFTITLKRDIAITDVLPSKSIVGESLSVNINATVENVGDITETFNITLSANGSIFNMEEITIPNGTSTILTFMWDTLGFQKGIYNVSVYAHPVPVEFNVFNNMRSLEIYVTIPGDVDGDFDVDIFDIVLVAFVYGTHAGEPNFISNCDIDGDGDVDIFDAVTTAYYYGQKYP